VENSYCFEIQIVTQKQNGRFLEYFLHLDPVFGRVLTGLKRQDVENIALKSVFGMPLQLKMTVLHRANERKTGLLSLVLAVIF